MFTVTVLEDGDEKPKVGNPTPSDRCLNGTALAAQLPGVRWTREHEADAEIIAQWLWGEVPGAICDEVYVRLRAHYQHDEGGNPDGN